MSTELELYVSLPGLVPSYWETLLKSVKACESYGFSGALVQFNHKMPDSWVLTSKILQHSTTMVPLVAVQPYSIPPFTLAKAIASIAFLYGRRIALNMITGKNPAERYEVGDTSSHDERYERLSEYLLVLRKLLTNEVPLSFSGRYYQYRNLRYFDGLMDQSLLPRIFIAGASGKATKTMMEQADVALTIPEPVDKFRQQFVPALGGRVPIGIRVGVIARPTREEAWAAARSHSTPSRLAYIKTVLNRTIAPSEWQQRIAQMTDQELHDDVYWLGPVMTGESHSPYLVGDYQQVADYLSAYVQCGVRYFILTSRVEEWTHNATVFHLVRAGLRGTVDLTPSR